MSEDVKGNKLVAAVCLVMKDTTRLEKAGNNTFANYKFTSVDDFKDAVRPLMAKYDLTVHVTEESFEIKGLETLDKSGKPKQSTVAVFKYAMTLEHADGEKGDPEKATVALPFVGAQTSGIAKSYAIKEWFKSRFLASSGDQQEEADLLDNTAEIRLSKQAAREMDKELREEMRGIVLGRDHIALREWWTNQRHRIEALPKDWEVLLRTDWISEGKLLAANASLDSKSDEELDEMAQQQEQR